MYGGGEMQISKLVFLGEIIFYIAKIFCLAAFTILFHLETSLQGNKKGRVDKICHIRHLVIHLYLYVHILPYKKLAAKQFACTLSHPKNQACNCYCSISTMVIVVMVMGNT